MPNFVPKLIPTGKNREYCLDCYSSFAAFISIFFGNGDCFCQFQPAKTGA